MNKETDKRRLSFSELYDSSEPVISLEFFPPKNPNLLKDTQALIASLQKQCPDFVTVTYGAGGSTRLLTRQLVSFIHNELEMPVVAHLTCIDHSLQEIEELVDNYHRLGINKILALRGDLPASKTDPTTRQCAFHSALELVKYLKRKGLFSMAVAGYPEPHREARSVESDLFYLKAKIDAGAEIIFTQLFFDPDLYLSFVERTAKFGINVPIVPGIMPVGSLSQIKKITELCGATIPKKLLQELLAHQNNQETISQIGTQHAIELCQILLKSGAPGLHLYTLNKAKQVCDILEGLFPEKRARPKNGGEITY